MEKLVNMDKVSLEIQSGRVTAETMTVEHTED